MDLVKLSFIKSSSSFFVRKNEVAEDDDDMEEKTTRKSRKLDVKMLPEGDWHCPNCPCKYCETVSSKSEKSLLTCGLCQKKYHESCRAELDFQRAIAAKILGMLLESAGSFAAKVEKRYNIRSEVAEAKAAIRVCSCFLSLSFMNNFVEPLPEPKRTLNRRLRQRNRRVPFEQRNNPPQYPRVVYSPILDINYFLHFLNILRNYDPMDDEPMWAADRVVNSTPGIAITIPETVNEFAIKDYSLTIEIFVRDKMSRDVITVGSTMRISLLYRGEYSQWRERFMNYLEKKTDGEAMINSIQNGDHPLPVIAQVSLAESAPNAIPTLKDPKFWTAEEKKTRKIDRHARSLLIQGLPNDIYSLIDSNDTAKDLWDALERQMRGSEYGEQDRKDAILYAYETFKATEGEQLLDTYPLYLQVINDLKKCGYKKDNCELNYKFLNNLQPEWKQYGDVNDALGYKKNAVVVTSDPLALVAEKTKVSKRKEKVKVHTESEGSDDEDISDLKKFTALLAKAFNRKKYYAKPTNNNLRTSTVSSSANKKPEYVKSFEKKEDKKADKKKRDMNYNYYKTKMLLAKKDSDEQVLLAEDQAWMESSSDSDLKINANMVFMAKMEKVLSDSDKSFSSAEETITEVAYYTSESESEFEYESLEFYDNFTNYGLFVNDDVDQEIFHDAIESASENFNENQIVSQKDCDESEVDHNDSEEKHHLVDKLIQKFNHKIAKLNTFEEKNNEFNEQMKVLNEKNADLLAQTEVLQDQLKVKHVVIDNHTKCQAQYTRLKEERYEYMIRYSALCDNDKKHRKKIDEQEILFDKMSQKIIIDLEDEVVTILEKEKENFETTESLKSKGFELSENAISEMENQSENDCQVVEKDCPDLSLDYRFGIFKAYDGGLGSFIKYSIGFKYMVPNVDEASTSHNVFNERLEDAYFDASTSFHNLSNVHTFYQPYPLEKKWTKDHLLHKIIGDSKSSVRTRALRDADWVSAMQDKLDQFARLKVWRLVPRPEGKTVLKTKWIFKNKKDESSLVIRNKVRLVAVRYSQQKGIDYDETFAPVTQNEAICLFLVYAAHKDFTVFQMDVKTSFLNGTLKEDMYVGQPPGFVSTQYPDHVYALDKALYGLKQAPQAWYNVLSQFLIDNGFQKGSIDTTLFIKKKVPTPIVEQAKLKLDLVRKPVDHTDYRSMIGSLMYVTSSRPDIMFATCDKLVCWSSKKQNCVSISTAESEYVAVVGCCAQVLWMRTQLTDYGFFYDKVPIYCDSKSAIAISCNPVQHTRTNHIDVRTGIDLPQSLPSNLGNLGLGDGV
uniref:Retrovirus-related Pol polyprotein from transposon TNT 1-94 n=1 Tax=Tanacetum cinerariifolium TaxID=118510 RepID=A0A6L2KQT1_TANCI|nr:retrovirus-related Pol polyprotein from transposon TNT 1-94 [Tanacetum cinerariifolium]